MKRILSLLLAAALAFPAFAADKPLVMQSGQIKALPAGTDLQLQNAIILPHITAPPSPVNGECWTTTAGLYCRISGATVGPYATGSGSVSSVAASGGTTGLSFSGGPITTSGTLTLSGTLAAANGGTGQSSYTAGDLLYASSSSALSKLAVGANNYVLTSNGAAPVWTQNTGTGNVGRATQPQFTSTIGVGTAASGSGSGVSFAATQSASTDANTLDDYEEGTWVPTVAASSGSITSYTSVGAYTKVGRKVSASVLINITTNGTGAGSLTFTLPFTAAAFQWVGAGRENALTGNMLQVIVLSGATSAVVLTYNGAYPGGTGNQIIASIDYFV